MRRIFETGKFFPVPDGTEVCPFLNPFDVNEKHLPIEILSGMSIAAGQIGPGVVSKIHIHPLVTQVTWVVDGLIQVTMKGVQDESPYSVEIHSGQAILTEPCTVFQLINPDSSHMASVLYIVSPAYVFDMEDDKVLYDDAIILDATWEDLASRNWHLATLGNLEETRRNRDQAMRRITERRNISVGQISTA